MDKIANRAGSPKQVQISLVVPKGASSTLPPVRKFPIVAMASSTQGKIVIPKISIDRPVNHKALAKEPFAVKVDVASIQAFAHLP